MLESNDNSRKKDVLIGLAYAAIALALYYVFFRYVIYAAWPFVIALIIALITRKPILWVKKKIHIPEKLSAAIIVFVFYAVIGSICVLIVFKAFWAIANWATGLPKLYAENIAPLIDRFFEWYENQAEMLPGGASYLNNISDAVIGKLGSAVNWISSKSIAIAQSTAIGIPKAFIGIIFMIISSFFIAMDYAGISHFFMAQLTPNQQQIVISGKEYLGTGIGRMFISYGLIMLITFIELNIGLRIIHINSPTTVALIIAIFDILPALGTGGIVIPWIVVELCYGNASMAFKLLVMYVIITVVRNILEPKIVGENIGVHPVLMLMSIYLGAYVLGPLGIIIVPFTLIVVRKLNDTGMISIFRSDYLPETVKRKFRKEKTNE